MEDGDKRFEEVSARELEPGSSIAACTSVNIAKHCYDSLASCGPVRLVDHGVVK